VSSSELNFDGIIKSSRDFLEIHLLRFVVIGGSLIPPTVVSNLAVIVFAISFLADVGLGQNILTLAGFALSIMAMLAVHRVLEFTIFTTAICGPSYRVLRKLIFWGFVSTFWIYGVSLSAVLLWSYAGPFDIVLFLQRFGAFELLFFDYAGFVWLATGFGLVGFWWGLAAKLDCLLPEIRRMRDSTESFGIRSKDLQSVRHGVSWRLQWAFIPVFFAVLLAFAAIAAGLGSTGAVPDWFISGLTFVTISAVFGLGFVVKLGSRAIADAQVYLQLNTDKSV